MATILPRIYPQMLDELYSHQDADRPTFIVSAAGNDLVSALARVLGADAGIGTRYEVDAEGKFTGRLDGLFVYREGKVDAMRRFADQHGIDLDASYAYSDSASDLPMLRAVGHPVAVNPDAELAGGRRAGGLGRDAVREARAPIGDRRHHGGRRRGRGYRQLARGAARSAPPHPACVAQPLTRSAAGLASILDL